MKITTKRTTTESEMTVVLDFSPIRPEYRKKIQTTIPFLNHMLEHIAWRGQFNIEAQVKLDEFLLTHVITEDLGIALGKALAEYVRVNRENGVIGFGDGTGMIDEAQAKTCMSFESRSYFSIDYHGIPLKERVEGMDTEDLETFLQGIAQGADCTLQIDVLRGENGHHIWEAVFRSLGTCLKNTLYLDESRRGMTSGVAGAIDWSVTVEE